jgi:hypothetical protein
MIVVVVVVFGSCLLVYCDRCCRFWSLFYMCIEMGMIVRARARARSISLSCCCCI